MKIPKRRPKSFLDTDAESRTHKHSILALLAFLVPIACYAIATEDRELLYYALQIVKSNLLFSHISYLLIVVSVLLGQLYRWRRASDRTCSTSPAHGQGDAGTALHVAALGVRPAKAAANKSDTSASSAALNRGACRLRRSTRVDR